MAQRAVDEHAEMRGDTAMRELIGGLGRRWAASALRPMLHRIGRRGSRIVLRLSGLANLDDRVAGVLLREGRRRLAAQRPHAASAVFVSIVQRSPSDLRRVLRSLAGVLERGDVATALAVYPALLEPDLVRGREHHRIRAAFGEALIRAGRPHDAVHHLRTAEQAPNQRRRQRTLLHASVEAGDAETARALLPARLAQPDDVSSASDDTILALGRGWSAELDERWSDAAASYGEAIRDQPDVASWYDARGRALERAGAWEAAREALEVAVSLDGRDLRWQRRLVRARRRSGAELDFPCPDEDGLERLLAASDDGLASALGEPELRGWLPEDADPDIDVLIRINGRDVATASATNPLELADGSTHLEFQRKVGVLWDHLGNGDVVEVAHGDGRLDLGGAGTRHVVTDERASCVPALFDRLDDGYVIDKYGRLKPSIRSSEAWQSAIMELYGRLRETLRERFGLELIPFYGTLLGAVREGDFLGHDNDFDTVYVSSATDPHRVKAEFRQICAYLIDEGFSLRVKDKHTWVRVPEGRDKLDIFFAWFDDDDRLQVSYGYHGPPVRRSDALFRLKDMPLGRYEIPVPENAEEVLVQLYGAGWRRPDPGFTHFGPTRVMDRRYHLTATEMAELHWRQFYRDHDIDEPSPFARFVAERLPPPRRIVEFGCGSGRDAAFFAAQGFRVLAGDRAPQAISRVEAKVRGDSLRARQVDLEHADDIRRFLGCLPDDSASDLVVYLRFVLHAVEETVEETLLTTLTEQLPRFRMCVEFRTERDASRHKIADDHYRRFIDEGKFATKLTDRFGFEVEHLEVGTGLSPFGDEDPHLARIIARYPGS